MSANVMSSNRIRVLIADPVALRSMEDDQDVQLITASQELSGFEVYIVEQWACSRRDPTITITTFTGHRQHKIRVAVLEVPSGSNGGSAQGESSLGPFGQTHARCHETQLGQILVTNLSTFPSALTILTVPDGDVYRNRTKFLINENLKRLGCSGRAGISLADPTESTLSRFRVLYKVSDRVKLSEAVIEMVQMCQLALSMFTKLELSSYDGLLCDLTQKGLTDWWTDIGIQYYSVQPSDGILGPTSVAALLGLFLGARNRLHTYGAPVPKDAFDIVGLKRGIAYFQNSQRLIKTRRLDHDTLQRLHRVTAKAAYSEGWTVPRAVKSTVAELGKGGEMVMGVVGVRERVSPADVETTEFDQFLKQVSGDQCKWLWQGKSRKTVLSRQTQTTSDTMFTAKEENLSHTNRSSGSEGEEELYTHKSTQLRDGFRHSNTRKTYDSILAKENDMALGRASSAKARRIGDSKRGLDRIREAVNTGLKISTTKNMIGAATKSADKVVENESRASWSAQSALVINPSEQYLLPVERRHLTSGRDCVPAWPPQKESFQTQNDPRPQSASHVRAHSVESPKFGQKSSLTGAWSGQIMSTPDLAISRMYHDEPVARKALGENLHLNNNPNADGRRHYTSEMGSHRINGIEQPTALIFDIERRQKEFFKDKSARMELISERIKTASSSLRVETQMKRKGADADVKSLVEIRHESHEALKERLREIEATDARLEYELGVLSSKIGEVEGGVADLDRQVSDLESRGRSLDIDSRHHTWQYWAETLIRRIGIT